MFDPSSFWPVRQHPTPRETRAPVGIKLLCIVGGLSTLWITYSELDTLDGGLGEVVLGGFLVAIGVAQLVGFYGLWTLQFWGWILVVSTYVLAVGIAVVFTDVSGVVTGSILAYYVYRKHEYYV